MNLHPLTPTFSVAPQIMPQIMPEDVGGLAAGGFRSVMCNRPDGEGSDQLNFAEIKAACRDAGLVAAYLPVVSGMVRDEDTRAFGEALDRLPKPAVAYCRTGTRSATLWSLSEAARSRPMVPRGHSAGPRNRLLQRRRRAVRGQGIRPGPNGIRGEIRHRTQLPTHADACNAPNAKTAAAARKQAPVVAHNLLKDMGAMRTADAIYDGYGSCPLTVERGRIVLAEFGYGGKLLPSFPSWLIDGTRSSRLAWLLKERMLPFIYWKAMLRGKEWMATPELAG